MNADYCDCSSFERSSRNIGNIWSLNRRHLLQAKLSTATLEDAQQCEKQKYYPGSTAVKSVPTEAFEQISEQPSLPCYK